MLNGSKAQDPQAELKVELLDWMEAVMGEKIPRDQPFEKVLKDGVVICNFANKIKPGSVKRINKKGGNFALMENHAAFQKAMKAWGVPDEEIFQTVDLFEARNIKQVCLSLAAFGRILSNHNGYSGPTFGPKMAEGEKREWDEEQQRQQRDAQLSLLTSGSNKGATASGVSMGATRHM